MFLPISPLEAPFDPARAQLLDLTLLCGWFDAISYVARAARLTPEPWAPRFGAIG